MLTVAADLGAVLVYKLVHNDDHIATLDVFGKLLTTGHTLLPPLLYST